MPVVQAYHLCYVIQPYAKTFDVVYIAGRYAVKLLEHMLLVGLRDANAMVLHTQHEVVVFDGRTDNDIWCTGRILDAVVNEVVHKIREV